MEIVHFLIDFILHIDKHLEAFVVAYGPWVYALLFVIVFVETGVVVMPFLPGDSLLFIVGALCGVGLMSFPIACVVLIAAAILGDQCNFTIGRHLGPKVFQWEDSRFFNRKAFNQAHAFYERYGGITIILARFMPFIRTFAPFVAGVAAMDRGKFTLFNVAGALLWVLGIGTAGYFFGNLPFVRQHLEKIIWGLILVPGLIAIFGAWRAGRAERARGGGAAGLNDRGNDHAGSDAFEGPARGPGRQARVGMRAALGAACLFVAGCATTDAPWPDKVVDAQRLQVVGRLHVARPIRNLSDPVAGGTTVLRLHIDAQGRVRRIEIAESSGDAGVDAAAVRGLSGATFVPYQEAGVPVAVTTLMPIHFKASSRCRGLRPLDC